MTSELKRRDDFNSDIDFGEAPFVDLGWHIMQVAVMPVVHVRRGTFRSVGSCFGIANDGLCVTARHVIEDAFGAIASSPDLIELDDERGYIAALYVSDEVHPDNPSQIVGGLLPMHRVYFNDGMDVALLKLNLPTDTRTGKTIFFPSHRLRMDFPVPGEPFFATGYRQAEWSMGEQPQARTLDHRYSATKGKVEEVHIGGRDRVVMPFPCFRTSARFDGGMSGGPLADHSGNVFGVVCSSFDTDGTGAPISYASPIGPALAIHLEMRDPDGTDRRGFLWDLVLGKAIDVEVGASQVDRSGDQITITFGCGLTLKNDLKNWA